MYQKRIFVVLAVCLGASAAPAVGQQFISGSWSTNGALEQQQQQHQQQPISSELHNQVDALSSQIAAATRQLQALQQQLALVDQQRLPMAQPQFFSQPQVQQQQTRQVPPTTLVEPNEQLDLVRAPARMFYPARRVVAQQVASEPASPQASPEELEQPLNAPLSEPTNSPPTTYETPAQQEPPVQFRSGQALLPPQSPHNPPRNDDKFAIGLGVLSPGYTQKFGNTALDFNQDKNGFSFTLSNNGHSNQPQLVKPAPIATR